MYTEQEKKEILAKGVDYFLDNDPQQLETIAQKDINLFNMLNDNHYGTSNIESNSSNSNIEGMTKEDIEAMSPEEKGLLYRIDPNAYLKIMN
ncbi:hypothetical protein HX049_05145 [Myroides odoratimimus]|uniref:hypothetical protein n=1 Tax=Myroides odoratimimus TaxID=76832 RepID=UPI0025749F84|nr:hypothetical protein [Myroides odoratimimus]MDM1396555.1 hypothetical protein [Myroides odoratimimus]